MIPNDDSLLGFPRQRISEYGSIKCFFNQIFQVFAPLSFLTVSITFLQDLIYRGMPDKTF